MSQASKQAERLAEFNKLIPELKIFLNHILDNEPLSTTCKKDCAGFINRLELVLKPPSLPPRSGKNSTTQSPIDIPSDATSNYLSDDVINSMPSDFIKEQRELSRNATLWKAEEKPSATTTKPQANELAEEESEAKANACDFYGEGENFSHRSTPPPVPERTNRSKTKTPSFSGIKVTDLPNPLYSGLLRNVGSNTKQWCVIKHQHLFLFNDLHEPVAFIADLTKYEVIKDPSDIYVFRVTQMNEPSIILAAVDENQYELWHAAFKRAKLMHLSSPTTSEKPYLSLPGIFGDHADGDEESSGYERPEACTPGRVQSPEAYLSAERLYSPPETRVRSPEYRVRSPEDLYVSMGPITSPRTLSPPIYESINPYIEDDSRRKYQEMDLPPTPGNKDAPPLPKRTRPGASNDKLDIDEESDSDIDSVNLDSSCESLEVKSDTELDKSRERDTTGQNWNHTMDNNSLVKGFRSKEVEFLRDLSATYCGILHQRRMLAVWQKRFCKLKGQSLLCYRTPEDSEPALNLSLKEYKLDRAEEAWRSYAFKIFKDTSSAEVYYFAAVSHAEQIRWLNVLAKAIHKEKFNSTSKLDAKRKSENSIDMVISSEDSFDSYDSQTENQSEEADVDSDVEMYNSPPKQLTNKHLHPAQKVRQRRRARTASLEDEDADLQGYLYKRVKNHWHKRWCVVKEKRFLSYKNNAKERPDEVVLLQHAALCTPTEDAERMAGNYYMFKLRFEDKDTVFRARREDDLGRWVDCLKKYVGSTSEESFPYINVPPSSEGKNNKEEEKTEYSIIDQDILLPNPVLPPRSSLAPPVPPPVSPRTAHKKNAAINVIIEKEQLLSYNQRRRHAPSWSEAEIEQSYMGGKLTELQICNQSFRHIERFVIVTKEKWLKVYEAINSTTPILVFDALDVEVKEEPGADSSVLHLLLGNVQVELLLKAADKQDCDVWKDIFERIHYEDVDDTADGGGGTVTLRPPARSRSRSIENEPSRLGRSAASRTMPNLGKRKKAAKDSKDTNHRKVKSIHQQQTLDTASSSPNHNHHSRRKSKAISSLIRSFTIDSLARKAKNKSYELPREQLREEDIVLKETQHGVLKQLVTREDGNQVYEDRFCRIRGKIFQCFLQEFDIKPLFKIPLRSAAIEEFVNPGTGMFRFSILFYDTMVEHTFAAESERDLESWTAALYGDDQLHKSASLENSPNVPRRVSGSTFYTSNLPASPVFQRASVGSKDSVTEEDDESVANRNRSFTEPLLEQDDTNSLLGGGNDSERSSNKETGDDTSATVSLVSMEMLRDPSFSDRVDTPDSQKSIENFTSGSISSLSSVTTSITTTAGNANQTEVDGRGSPAKTQQQQQIPSKLKALVDEPIKFSNIMYEISASAGKSKRWVVLRKTVLELYKNEQEKGPLSVVNLATVEICSEEDSGGTVVDKNQVILKTDSSEIQLVAPDEQTQNKFVRELNKSVRSLKRQKNPRHSVTMHIKKRLGSGDKLKELKSKKDKRISMLLVDDDVEAIEKYHDSADPTNNMSGVLKEYFEDTKSSKEKERYCWVQNGFFNIAKIVKTKPVKTIDLSTVVVLDESDSTIGKYAFKLEYTNSNGKRTYVFLRALDAMLADKWMVAVSMGILYHRLTGAGSSTSHQQQGQNKESDGEGGYDFVPLSIPEVSGVKLRAESDPAVENKEAPLRKEIMEKLGKEDIENLKLVQRMLADENDGGGGQHPNNEDSIAKDELKEEENEEQEHEDEEQEQGAESNGSNNKNLSMAVVEEGASILLKTQLSNLNDEEDQVFDGTTDQSFELLENIPEKENADEAFRNVKGILRQQESIRRTILKNQREKRVPPPVKRKPSKLVLQKPTYNDETVVHKYGPLGKLLNLTKLHSYAEQLRAEKSTLLKCVKQLNALLTEAVVVTHADEQSHGNGNSVTGHEYNVLAQDLEYYQERLSRVEKELKDCRIHITRKTASKGIGIVSPEMLKRPQGGGRLTPAVKNENTDTDTGTENTETVLRDKPGRHSSNIEDVESIII